MKRTTAFTIILLSGGICAQDMIQNNTISRVNNKKASANTIHIDLNESARKQVADRLAVLLANEFTLYTKTLKYHWNVVGPFFGPLHDLFGKQYEQLSMNVDRVAERIRALNHMAQGTLAEFQKLATIEEMPGENPNATGMIQDLLNGHETIIRHIREDIDLSAEVNDMGTNNFLGDLIEQHEKTAWMLRAHLQ